MLKKIICLFAAALLLCLSCLAAFAAEPEMSFDVMSESALLVNTDTGTVMYEKNSGKKQPTIAFNKIVTAAVAIEETDDIDATKLTVSKNAVTSESLGGYGSGIEEGEKYSMRDMLSSILISSANDCCIVIAEHIAGSEAEFVEKMNALASRLECADTNFTDVHGVDDEGQFTTCADMKKIIEYARTLPNFYDICCQSSYELPATDKQDGRKLKTNISMMLKGTDYSYSPVRGIKYGYSPSKGRNFASTATRSGYNYMLITMNGPIKDKNGEKLEDNSAFLDAKNLYSWAFDGFRIKQILSETVPITEVEVKYSLDSNKVQAIPETSITAIVPKSVNTNEINQSGDLEYVLDLPESLTAPVKKGQVLGTVTVKYGDRTLGEVSLLAGQSLNKSEYIYVLEVLKGIVSQTWFKIAAIAIGGLIVIYITAAIISNFIRTSRNKLRREQEEQSRRDDRRNKR